MSDEKKPEVTSEDMKKAILEETLIYLEAGRAEIVKKARARLRLIVEEKQEKKEA